MYSVLAGFMISVGGYINLTLGGIAGALFFAIGLLTILHFHFDLFTGKASVNDLSGPVGMTQVVGEAAQVGLPNLTLLLACKTVKSI